MARSIADEVGELEDELSETLNEVKRLREECSELEGEIGDLKWDLREATAIVNFVTEHFPEAIAAFEVRVKMEVASG